MHPIIITNSPTRKKSDECQRGIYLIPPRIPSTRQVCSGTAGSDGEIPHTEIHSYDDLEAYLERIRLNDLTCCVASGGYYDGLFADVYGM
jgi:hypothetical protein